MSLSSGNQKLGLMSREDMLRELELLPVWQLRQPLPTLADTHTPPADATLADATVQMEPVPAVSVSEMPMPETPILVATEIPVIETVLADDSAIQSSFDEADEAATPDAEFSMPLEAGIAEQIGVAEQIEPPVYETEPLDAGRQAVAAVKSAPLRFLLCENSHYGFLMAADAAVADEQAVETLFNNMLRAMRLNVRVDVTDSVEHIFAAHSPKILLSMGEAPANRLFGKGHAVDEWRSLQQQSPLLHAGIPVIVTYHPAHLLQNTADKANAWRDLCTAMQLMQRL